MVRQTVLALAFLLALSKAQPDQHLFSSRNQVPGRPIWIEDEPLETRSASANCRQLSDRHVEHNERLREVLDDHDEGVLRVKTKQPATLWLVHFKRTITSQMRTALDNALTKGERLMYLPDDTFLVSASVDDLVPVRNIPEVNWIGAMPSHAKLSRELKDLLCDSKEKEHSLKEEETLYVKPLAKSRKSAADWAELLRQSIGDVDVKMSPRGKVIIRLSGSTVVQASTLLASQDDVVVIERKPEFKLHNKYARWITQSGQPGETSVWSKGLTGQNQVVGVGDTGLDVNLCFFSDPEHDVPFNTVDLDHRKIVSYRYYIGAGDATDSDGHGSHVCGSVAGAAFTSDTDVMTSLSEYNGMAPSAKIAFTDIMAPGMGLDIPDDLTDDYFQHPYNATARIHSNSWGSTGPYYTSTAHEIDSFMFDHPDFLIMFAAGNDGPGLSSVGAPSTCKNCISVGASDSALASFKQNNVTLSLLNVSFPGNSTALTSYAAAFGPDTKVTGKAVLSDPRDACSRLYNQHRLNGSVAVVVRGDCFFVEKVLAVQAAGALGVVVVDNGRGAVRMAGSEGADNVTIPSVMITEEDGAALLAVMDQWGEEASLTFPFSLPIDGLYSKNDLAYFSGRGPTSDGRFKPDLVAPGYSIFSAKSQTQDEERSNAGTCSPFDSPNSTVHALAGTSMATPVAAGNAALVRQYFVEGFYPSGQASPRHGFAPSAALVKATMVASCVPLTGNTLIDNKLIPLKSGALPNYEQGHGNIRLDNALFFDGDVGGMVVADANDEHSLETDETWSLRVQSQGHPMRVVLAWTDPPLDLETARKVLVNDLDLTVQYDDQTVYGNQLRHNVGVQHEAMETYPARDHLNNLESVTLDPAPPQGTVVTIFVSGYSVPQGPQKFALVVAGVGTGVMADDLVPSCPSNCNGHGVCNAQGMCDCDADHYGPACERDIVALTEGETGQGVITSDGDWNTWFYFSFDVTTQGGGYVVEMEAIEGDPDLYIHYEQVPTIADYTHNNMQCDNCGFFGPSGNSVLANVTAKTGRYYIGVRAYCCQDVHFMVNFTLIDCAYQPLATANPPILNDQCMQCGGDGTSCAGCDGIPNSNKAADVCGVCGGDGESCVGCDGVAFSGTKHDPCGECGGAGTSCTCEHDTHGNPTCGSEPLHLHISLAKSWAGCLDPKSFTQELAHAASAGTADAGLVAMVPQQIQLVSMIVDYLTNARVATVRVRGPPDSPQTYAQYEALLVNMANSGRLSSVGVTKSTTGPLHGFGITMGGAPAPAPAAPVPPPAKAEKHDTILYALAAGLGALVVLSLVLVALLHRARSDNPGKHLRMSDDDGRL